MQDGEADKAKPVPDIARQFTKNLRNLADMISVSATSPAILEQNLCSQSAQVKLAVEANDEEGEPSVSRGPNTWGDVEHLFKGYDDKQIMAIQRERERRLEEQNKMFEARKLCLVLDLDHTLLNSAKVESCPVCTWGVKKLSFLRYNFVNNSLSISVCGGRSSSR